ncbi:MAG: extracellular solute-binding protein [Lachnospiraceae bacterium]|nr:extracellular solute-binding protein [Lachnospiraceae bacterium]
MKKKLVSVALATAVATTMLAGCAGSGTNTGSNKKDDGKTVLSLGIWPSDDLVDDVATFEGYTDTMKDLHPDVTVKPAHYTYATDTFVSLASSGNCPTIFETWYTEPQKLIKQGLCSDITKELKARGWDADMSEEVKALMSDENGNIYGVPRDGYVLGLMCNVELFEQAGLVDADGIPIFPKTMDELAQTAKTIKDKTGAAGLCLLAKDGAGGWHFSNIAWNFGAQLVTQNDDGTYTSNLESKEAIEAMKYVYDLKWKYDVLTADPTAEDWGTGFQQLGTGGAAMYIGANDAVNQPTQVNGLAVDKLAMCAIPAGPNGDQYSLTGGTPYMFSKDATEKEINAALDFLEVMGKSPVVTDTVLAGMKASAQDRVKNGVPVIKSVQCWTNKEYLDAEAAVIDEFKNVDAKLYDSYFENSKNIKPEEPGDAQEMYSQLTNVLQAVLTDKNCDIEALMKQADENYQSTLDSLSGK